MTMMQGLWAVPYLMDVHGLTPQEAANMLTLWAIGLIVGCTLWGYVADTAEDAQGRHMWGSCGLRILMGSAGPRARAVARRRAPIAMFWGGFFASTWIPAYALLKEAVPSQVIATAMGTLNLFFLGRRSVYQQASALFLESFPKQTGHIPATGYQTLFWICFASVAVSIALVARSTERRAAVLSP